MRSKRKIGFVLMIIGIILIIYSVHSMNRISRAKGEVHGLTSPFSGSSAGRAAGGMMENEASKYDTTVMLLLISGIGLAVVGGGMALFYRKK